MTNSSNAWIRCSSTARPRIARKCPKLRDDLFGILVGSGELPHPGEEYILETYYGLQWFTSKDTFDYQIDSPA